MKTIKDRIKSKVKAKAKAVKAKLKGAKKCAVALAVAALAAGCMETQPASRATTASYRIDVTLKIDEGSKCGTVNMPFTLGDGALASADSAGSTETQTATPTMDVKPDVDVSVPVNKSGGGAQSVGSVLGDAAAAAVKGLVGGKDATPSPAACADGSCTDCEAK